MEIKHQDSLFYQINSTAKYFDRLFEQFFKELNIGVGAMEHLALRVIQTTKDCCQRDLARALLKDRANTGKLALKLEQKGLIKIENKEKNNKLVKILTITKKGEEICNEIMKSVAPKVEQFKKEVSQETIDNLKKNLLDIRCAAEKIVKMNI